MTLRNYNTHFANSYNSLVFSGSTEPAGTGCIHGWFGPCERKRFTVHRSRRWMVRPMGRTRFWAETSDTPKGSRFGKCERKRFTVHRSRRWMVRLMGRTRFGPKRPTPQKKTVPIPNTSIQRLASVNRSRVSFTASAPRLSISFVPASKINS